MTAAPNDPIAALRDKFTIRDTVSDWLIGCPKCRKRWALEKPAEGATMHPGNILALLDHAAGHRERAT